MFSRRDLLALSAAGAAMVGSAHAATFGNPDEPPQGAINAKNSEQPDRSRSAKP